MLVILPAWSQCEDFATTHKCAMYQGDSRSAAPLREDATETVATLRAQPFPEQRGRKQVPPGLIMWSFGRSGTGSFMQSLANTSGLKFCHGSKESFNRNLGQPALTSKSLQECMDRGEPLTHLKPEHLTGRNSTLRSPHEFFGAAYKAGFRTVVASFRENQLTRDVSSYRLAVRAHKDLSAFESSDGVFANLIHQYERARRKYTAGVEAAREIGFTIVPCSFAILISDVCACVQPALSTLSRGKSFKCQERQDHVEDANTEKTLSLFVPAELEALIREQLLGTPYEWMLNLGATDWPKDVAPQLPVPTWRQNPSLK
eukprot:Skav207832  [mRNA]  locus=scaffold3131:173863:174810:- [translate_table: standard]